MAAQDKPEKPIKMNLSFYASPKKILGTDRVEGIRLEKTQVVDGRAVATGETFDMPCGAVVTAIGYGDITALAALFLPATKRPG